MGLTTSVLALVFGLVSYFSTRKYIPLLPRQTQDASGNKAGIIDAFRNFAGAFKNKNYRYVVLGYLFTNIASSFALTLGVIVFTYTFMLDNNGISLVVGAQFVVSIISQFIWVYISKRIDKKLSVIIGLLTAAAGCIAFIVLVLLREHIMGNPLYLMLYAVPVGFGTGGLYSIPISMIADTIDVEELEKGVRSEGTYYGCLTLSYKIPQVVTTLLLGLMLDIVKFNANLQVQTESTVMIVGLILPVASMVVFILAALSFSRYSLNRKLVADIQSRLLESRAGKRAAQ
jgi:Na+/melibiose symporter-like transporter